MRPIRTSSSLLPESIWAGEAFLYARFHAIPKKVDYPSRSTGKEAMLIDVYSDVVCPWCFIGEKRLAKALEPRPDIEVEVHWRPFQLQPGMPKRGLPWAEFCREKFGSERGAEAAFSHVSAVGEEEGIRFDFGRVASAPNTVDAHRLILFDGNYGRQWELANAIF